MAISNEERVRTLGLARVERLLAEGREAVASGGEADAAADALLALSQQSSDAQVAEAAMLAHAVISGGQLASASKALAAVNDAIASAAGAFGMAARIAEAGEADLTFPFVAGKAASLLELLNTLEESVKKTAEQVDGLDSTSELLEAFKTAKASLKTLRRQAEALVGS